MLYKIVCYLSYSCCLQIIISIGRSVQLKAMTSSDRARLYSNTRKLNTEQARQIIEWIESAGLPFSDGGSDSQDNPLTDRKAVVQLPRSIRQLLAISRLSAHRPGRDGRCRAVAAFLAKLERR